MKQKFCCSLLAFLMICFGAPVTVFAEESVQTSASGTSGETVIYEQNFEALSAVSGFADLGWKETFNGNRITTALKINPETGNHYLEISDTGWSALELVPAERLKDAFSFTVSMKVTIGKLGTAFSDGKNLGIFGLIYNNATPTNQNNGGMLVIRNNSNDTSVYLANAGKRNNTYYCAPFDGEGTEQWRGKWAKLSSFLSIDSVKDIPLDLSFTVDQKAKICTVFVNGKIVNICENIVTDPGGIHLLLQAETAQIDDIKVTCRYQSNLWVQFRNNGNGTEDMRIVGILDSLNYKEIGYRITMTYNGQTHTEEQNLKYVYQSLSAKYGTEELTPQSLGCISDEYLTALTVQNIPMTGTVILELTFYSVAFGAAERLYRQPSATITLTDGTLTGGGIN